MFSGQKAKEARGFSTERKVALLYNRCFRPWENRGSFFVQQGSTILLSSRTEREKEREE